MFILFISCQLAPKFDFQRIIQLVSVIHKKTDFVVESILFFKGANSTKNRINSRN